jgi:hypothetical protein
MQLLRLAKAFQFVESSVKGCVSLESWCDVGYQVRIQNLGNISVVAKSERESVCRMEEKRRERRENARQKTLQILYFL